MNITLNVLDLICIVAASMWLLYLFIENKKYNSMDLFDWFLAVLIIFVCYGALQYWGHFFGII